MPWPRRSPKLGASDRLGVVGRKLPPVFRDRDELLRYGRACIDVLYRNYVGHDLPLTTISLVQGECLGGGFEAALSSDVIVAEINMAEESMTVDGTVYQGVVYVVAYGYAGDDYICITTVDGAGPWKQFKHVTLPAIAPTLLLVSIISVAGFFQLFAEPYVMTQGGPYGRSTVLAYQMYDATIFSYRAGYGAAIATVLFVIMSFYIGWFLRHTLREEKKGR